jgi:hypothetical protein
MSADGEALAMLPPIVAIARIWAEAILLATSERTGA